MTIACSSRPDPPREPLGPDDEPGSRSDHEVIEQSRHAPEVFAELFERYAGEMHRFLSRRVGALADDLLGELFTSAFECRTAYRPSRANARPWLYGIATNLVRRHYRAEATRLRALARVPGDLEATDRPVEDEALSRAASHHLRPRLAAALADLKAADRDVLLLTAWGHLDQGEIADALDIPPGTVRSRLHRARRQLKPLLSDLTDHHQGEPS